MFKKILKTLGLGAKKTQKKTFEEKVEMFQGTVDSFIFSGFNIR